MENRIKDYEKFISKAAAHPTPALIAYHREMLTNFQHERLIHLIITLFFATLTLAALALSALALSTVESTGWLPTLPFHILSVLLVILTFFYVKHYYFLENHVQKLYDISRKLLK